MNPITLHKRDNGHEVEINTSAISMIEGRENDSCVFLNCEWVFVKESLPEIRALLNPMRAFTGKRDVETAAEQDTRTKLLIEAMHVIYGSTIPGAKVLYDAIKKEVGEAAIEQFMRSQSKG